jgi:hypothetical protein
LLFFLFYGSLAHFRAMASPLPKFPRN